MSLGHFICRQWWILAIMLMSVSVTAQYRVKVIETSKNITSLHPLESGALEYGTENGELGTFDGLKFSRKHTLPGSINKIEKDDVGTALLTSKGIYEMRDDELKLKTGTNLNVLAKSSDNSFLVTANGVYHLVKRDYQPDKEDFFNINEIKLGSYFELGDKVVFRADRNVYIKDNSWKEIIIHRENDFDIIPWNSKQMLVCDRNALVTFDDKGYVDSLLTFQSETRNKIFKLAHSKVLLCANDSIGIYNARKRKLNNFYSLKTSSIKDVTVDNWGNIWVASGINLYQIVDATSSKRNESPYVQIDAVRIDGKLQTENTSLSIYDKENDVEIDFSGVHMTYPQDLEFETMLSARFHSLGYTNTESGQWEKASSGNVDYRDLTSGKYTFQVRATIDGVNYTYTKPIIFNVDNKLFQSIWLYGIIGGLGVLALALFYNSRYNSLKEKSRQDREILIRENKMLSLQQKALQLQMNPHFVFNALNSIQGLIAQNDTKKSRKYLQEFATMMRSVLNQSRSETILLSDEINYLKSYLNLEQMANNHKFDWSIESDPELEDDIRIPTMIIQPFVENAILHGVKSLKDRKGLIQLSFRSNGNTVMVNVKDNGVGRQASAKHKPSQHTSVALDVVRERLTSKRKLSKGNPIQYKDLLDEHSGESEGTLVSLTIPIMN